MDWKPEINNSTPKKVIVLGGGLAGLSAARSLLEYGCDVTLVEKRPFLGGRAFSFYDPKSRSEIDNGQHVFLGNCTYYIDFLKALGMLDKTFVQDKLKVEVILNGKRGILSSTSILGSLHLVPSFMKYPHLGITDKFWALYGLIKAKRLDLSKNAINLDQESLYNWLKRHHQTERAINNLWNLFILPALNDDVRQVSASMGLMVFQESLLKKPLDAILGFSKIGLSSLTGASAQHFLEKKGGQLILGKTVKSLTTENGRIGCVNLSNGDTLQSDFYISALPFDTLLQILPQEISTDSFFSKASELSFSPIIGIHLWYDKPIMDQDFVSFLDSPIQWVFNRTLIQGDNKTTGQHICISISGAWEYMDKPKEEIRRIFVQEMRKMFPKASSAQIERSLVIKQPQATFRSVPGMIEHRLPQTTPITNLYLAGEWTNTGWPSTMEGAVRSGVFAAKALF